MRDQQDDQYPLLFLLVPYNPCECGRAGKFKLYFKSFKIISMAKNKNIFYTVIIFNYFFLNSQLCILMLKEQNYVLLLKRHKQETCKFKKTILNLIYVMDERNLMNYLVDHDKVENTTSRNLTLNFKHCINKYKTYLSISVMQFIIFFFIFCFFIFQA